MGIDPFTGGPDTGWRPGDAPRQPSQAISASTARSDKKEETLFLANFRYDPHKDPKWAERPGAQRDPPYGYRKTTYNYRDEQGLPTMLLHRYDKEDPSVDGRQKLLITVSPWVRIADNTLALPTRPSPEPHVLYGAHTLIRKGTVWFVEGEKCADALDALLGHRFPVVSAYGSQPARTNLAALCERTTLVMPDHDKPGEKWRETVLGLIGGAGKAVASPWRGPPGTKPPEGWDIADDILDSPLGDGTKLGAITLPAFIKHLRRCAAADRTGSLARAAGEIERGI
jgi:hypothetical protein